METTKDARPNTAMRDQRPPPRALRHRPPVPRSAMRRTRAAANNASLAEALGWLGVGMGLAALAAPRAVARGIGVDGHAGLTRLCGARELACGIGLLAGRNAGAWLWARVAGDVMDLALLGSALTDRRNDRARTAAAALAVAGVAAVDAFAARRVQEEGIPKDIAATHGIHVEKTFAVNRPARDCYDRWRRFEELPRFMKHVESVTVGGPGLTHWVATAPGGATVEWDAEITNDQPGRLLAWRSLEDSDVDHSGVVRFDPGPDERSAIVRVEMHYKPPAGRIGAAIARLFGEEPSQTIEEDLRRFKRMMETGEIPTTEGQAAGRRSALFRLLRKGHAR